MHCTFQRRPHVPEDFVHISEVSPMATYSQHSTKPQHIKCVEKKKIIFSYIHNVYIRTKGVRSDLLASVPNCQSRGLRLKPDQGCNLIPDFCSPFAPKPISGKMRR